jgi:acyl-CoA reductase-like NAD-dependent aldehyde dehydrogenase
VKVLASYINGVWVEAGPPIGLREPATGAVLAEVAMASAHDVDQAVSAARGAMNGKWGRTRPSARSRMLHAFADLVQNHAGELIEIESRNVGKAIREVTGELAQAVEILRFYASICGQDRGAAQRVNGSVLHYATSVPVGVCAQIVPWNYPAMLAVWKLAPALAAGCTVVLKPDPQTPLTALRLAELATEAGFPSGVINVVIGDGPNVGATLVAHPGVDKVAFTGSTATGAQVMRLAADPIKRLSLELGGKSPNIIFGDADLAAAIDSSVWAIAGSAGQSCEARSRLFVEHRIYDECVARLVDRANRLRMGDPLDAATEIGSLISGTHRQKVHAHVEQAARDGGDVLLGGTIPRRARRFLPAHHRDWSQ